MQNKTFHFLSQNAPWLGAGALLMAMSSFGQTFFISIFAGEIKAAFQLTDGEWGSIYGIGTMASAIAMIWAGGLTDVYRARTLGMFCLLALGASCLLMAFNTFVALLPLIVFCLRFAGQGMASHIAMVSMARWFVATRGRALATASLGYSVCEMTLPFIFVFLMTFFDWRYLWVVSAVICLAATFGLRKILSEERVPGATDNTRVRAGQGGRHWTRKEVLHHPTFWLLSPALLGLPAFGTAVLFHQVIYSEIKGIDHFVFVSLFPVYSGTLIAMMIVSGIALDRYGTVRLIRFFLLPISVAFILFGLAETIVGIAVAFVFFGMTSGAYGTLTNAFWAEVYGTDHIGKIKSLATAIMVLGSALGPSVTGILIDQGVGLETQYLFISGYFLVASACIWAGVRGLDKVPKP